MKAINAYILELKYWADLSILGYFWTIIKPCAFYFTTYFIIGINNVGRDDTLLHSLDWSIFWFSALNCVQSCKRLRKFVIHGSFGASDLVAYSVIDMIFNFCILLMPFFILSDAVNISKLLWILFSLVFYCISIPLFLYVGVLSVNASDFSSTFGYVPMILIGMITQGWGNGVPFLSPFLAMSGREYDERFLVVVPLVVAALALLVFRLLRGKLHALYSEAIV